MTEKRQAVIDAIKAIQEARSLYGKKPSDLPKGTMEIEVDPQLDEPKHNTTNDLRNQDVKIEDPDHVLDQQRDEKQKRQDQSNKNNSQQNSQDSQQNNHQNQNKNGSNAENKENQNTTDEKNNKNQFDSIGDKQIDKKYEDAWNEIMDRFDDESISEDELKQLIDRIESGSITSI